MQEKLSDSDITVVIPVRGESYPKIALQTLSQQPVEELNVIVSRDEGKGANFARNKGFKKVKTKLVLFSDDDIRWKPDAFKNLLDALNNHPEASYSYGAYVMNGKTHCAMSFFPEALKIQNYISTMSLIRTDHFVGFDESIKRLQDWDLWLNMLINYGRIGVYCGRVIFHTDLNPKGISGNGSIPYEDARQIILAKYNYFK